MQVDGSAPIDRGEHLKLAADSMYKAENAEDVSEIGNLIFALQRWLHLMY